MYTTLPLFLLSLLHLHTAPHTKVEESHNLHAIHTFLNNKQYTSPDWIISPGPVDRTLIPAYIIAAIVRGIKIVISPFIHDNQHTDNKGARDQFIARLVILCLFACAHHHLAKSIQRCFNRRVRWIFEAISCSQFHSSFYASRTLPNTFAMMLWLPSLSYYLRVVSSSRARTYDIVLSLGLAVAASLILRCELGVMVVCMTFGILLAHGQRIIKPIVIGGLVSALVSSALTILVDSHYYGRWCFPEPESFFSNVLQNKSAEWGTSPWHYYWLSSLPKVLAGTYGLQLFAPRGPARHLLNLSIAYTNLLSGLAHKEWRFIWYVVPMCNVATAAVLEKAWQTAKQNRHLSILWRFVLAALLLSTAGISTIRLLASSQNYAGGDAVRFVNTLSPDLVILGNYPCQAGASNFYRIPGITYLKPQLPVIPTLPSVAKNIFAVIGKEDLTLYWHWELIKTCKGFERILYGLPHKLLQHDVDWLPQTLLPLERYFRYIIPFRLLQDDKIWVLKAPEDRGRKIDDDMKP